MDKEHLIKIIKEWVTKDNEIRELQKEQNVRKVEKKKLTNRLMEIMKTNNIDCFDINDGQILYKKKDAKKAMTQKNLLSVLQTFYEGDIIKAEEVNNFILENREKKTTESIIRKSTKVHNL